ncbi:hypothetical protein VIBNIPon4_1320019 [Vibrio nigripulchritudo POn4]|nr:hypothetical protein VIBNIAM115_1070019 [Vibrio nigripulchritudo AM115]CCN42810.1 hypothetical protein VIBNIFTn2_40019 [Vibrio nigripulchritudo FTn2]CCN63605.1 hypothetical protein VIBNIPon4_1320019 [Vibrio nigripulchritudo POn4]
MVARLGDGFSQNLIVPAIKKAPACLRHFFVITRIFGAFMMRWHQVNVAFFRDIKLVVVLAAIGSLIQLQIVLAKGALICHVKLKDANWGQSLAAIAINKKCLAGKNLNNLNSG